MATVREKFTAVVEHDEASGMYIGYVPELPGAATQGATLDELYANLREVAELVLEDMAAHGEQPAHSHYVGTYELTLEIQH